MYNGLSTFFRILSVLEIFVRDFSHNVFSTMIVVSNFTPLGCLFLVLFTVVLFPFYVYFFPTVLHVALLVLYYSSLLGIFVISTLLQSNYVINSLTRILLICVLVVLVIVALCIIGYMYTSILKHLLDFLLKMNSAQGGPSSGGGNSSGNGPANNTGGPNGPGSGNNANNGMPQTEKDRHREKLKKHINGILARRRYDYNVLDRPYNLTVRYREIFEQANGTFDPFS